MTIRDPPDREHERRSGPMWRGSSQFHRHDPLRDVRWRRPQQETGGQHREPPGPVAGVGSVPRRLEG